MPYMGPKVRRNLLKLILLYYYENNQGKDTETPLLGVDAFLPNVYC